MKHLALLLVPLLLGGCVTWEKGRPDPNSAAGVDMTPLEAPPANVSEAPATPKSPTTSPVAPSGDVLIVTARGFRSDQGQAAFALFDDDEAYARSGRPLRAQFVPIAGGEATWRVEGVSPGRYAVKAYHDQNGNRTLDRGAFGVPKEPYGFSNDARGRRGPPLWSASSFDVTSGESRATFSVRR